MVSVLSFGYKYGLPAEADLVFDVRFLPNPNFVPRLRRLTGADAPGRLASCGAKPDTARFLQRVLDLVGFVLPRYEREGQELPHHRDRLHRRPAPLGDARERGGRGASAQKGFPVRVEHRDVRQE